MSKLVQETLLKPDLIKNIVPSLLNEIKAELISEFLHVLLVGYFHFRDFLFYFGVH
jgi:hypothetical protein